MTGRDVHRQRVYDAEHAAFGGTLLDDLLEWPALVAVVDAVTHSPWWQELAVPPPRVRPAREDSGRSSAHDGTIRFARSGRTALTAAHELAHHLVGALVDPGATPHGPEFRAAELRTVAVVGGVDARRTLAEEFRRWGLPVAPWAWPEPPEGPGLALRGVIAL